MKVKGIRDILSINSFVRRATPQTRAQLAAELARLEYEKQRLERELELRRQTEARLQLTQERIKFLVGVLEDLTGRFSVLLPQQNRVGTRKSGEGEHRCGCSSLEVYLPQ